MASPASWRFDSPQCGPRSSGGDKKALYTFVRSLVTARNLMTELEQRQFVDLMSEQRVNLKVSDTNTNTAPPKKDRNLLTRVVTALVLLPALLWLIWRGGEPLALLVAVAAMLAAIEFYGMTLGDDRLKVPGALAAFAIPLALLHPQYGEGLVLWLLALMLVGTLVWRLFENRALESAMFQSGMVVFGSLYLALMGFLVKLRGLGAESSWEGSGWLLLAVAATFSADTGAYFAGRFLGKRKLFPRISPKKTWAGFWGGVASAMLAGIVIRSLGLLDLSLVHVAILGLLCGTFGTLGDLSESMLKRSAKVKDSGSLLPGHGGMLDRIDGLLFNAPVVYAYAVFVLGS